MQDDLKSITEMINCVMPFILFASAVFVSLGHKYYSAITISILWIMTSLYFFNDFLVANNLHIIYDFAGMIIIIQLLLCTHCPGGALVLNRRCESRFHWFWKLFNRRKTNDSIGNCIKEDNIPKISQKKVDL